jgi:ADP-ribose pyrophosphatase YjhB (NUDIX family)
MWEPYTERARRSVVLAQEEAQRLGNNYIGTEHMLLGVVSEGESISAKVLHTHNVTLRKIRAEVEAIVGRGSMTTQQEMVFTPRAKRVMELAFNEAQSLQQNYVSADHLFIGIVREAEGVAGRVLMNLGVTDSIIQEILNLMTADRAPKVEKKNKFLVVGTSAVIIRNNSVLLGKRIGKFGNGLYQCPGGHPEPGETFEQTLVREGLEETGLDLHVGPLICYQDDYFAQIDRWYRTFFYTCWVRNDEEPRNMEPEKCEGWKWFAPADFPRKSQLFEMGDSTIAAILNRLYVAK